MKARKFITEIATQITKQNMKKYSFITEENFDKWVKSEAKELLEVREALLKGRFYIGVVSSSKSNMSRIIKIGYIKNNKLQGVSDSIYELAGCDKNHRISGCGMDMLFAAQYNLFLNLCPRHKYQKSMPRYNQL